MVATPGQPDHVEDRRGQTVKRPGTAGSNGSTASVMGPGVRLVGCNHQDGQRYWKARPSTWRAAVARTTVRC